MPQHTHNARANCFITLIRHSSCLKWGYQRLFPQPTVTCSAIALRLSERPRQQNHQSRFDFALYQYIEVWPMTKLVQTRSFGMNHMVLSSKVRNSANGRVLSTSCFFNQPRRACPTPKRKFENSKLLCASELMLIRTPSSFAIWQ